MQHTADMGTQKSDGASGKRALITGASGGLGLELAELLAAQKVNLVLAARRREPMEKLATDLRRKHGVDVLVEPIDLAAPGAAARLKSSLDEKSVQIDILVNNAGYGLHGDFLKTPIERTTEMIQLNITALTELSFAFGHDMAARGGRPYSHYRKLVVIPACARLCRLLSDEILRLGLWGGPA
jgi:hypothetical protein